MLLFTLAIFAGNDALAAVFTYNKILMRLVAVIMGLNVSTDIILSKAIGSRDKDEANKIASTMLSCL